MPFANLPRQAHKDRQQAILNFQKNCIGCEVLSPLLSILEDQPTVDLKHWKGCSQCAKMKTYMKEPFHVSWFLGQLPKLSEVYSFQEYTTLVNGAIEERATATLDIEPENERQQSLYTHYKHRSGEQTDQQSTLVSDAKIFPQAQDIKEVRLKATRRKTLFHKTGAYIGFSNLVRCGKYFNLNQDEKSVKRSASPSSEPEQAPPAPKRRLQKV